MISLGSKAVKEGGRQVVCDQVGFGLRTDCSGGIGYTSLG